MVEKNHELHTKQKRKVSIFRACRNWTVLGCAYMCSGGAFVLWLFGQITYRPTTTLHTHNRSAAHRHSQHERTNHKRKHYYVSCRMLRALRALNKCLPLGPIQFTLFSSSSYRHESISERMMKHEKRLNRIQKQWNLCERQSKKWNHLVK